LPATLRDRVAAMTGDKLEDVRLHNDTAAHTAASLMGARAFTVGRDIYFAAGEFQPSSRAGLALVAHEAAHTIQQKNATRPAMDSLPVGAQGDAHEHEAEHFAAAVCGDATPASLSIAPTLSVARVQRAISFSSGNHAVAKNTMGVTETAAGFQIQPNATPLFNWTADVTIRGNAGDVFGDWDVGPHQVVRHLYNNVYWGSGANQGHRLLQVSPVPIRDATAAGNTWYHDPLAAAGYAASGDVLNTGLNDSPQTGVHPWANPVPGKAGNSGYFNYGAAFVAYISARHIPTGTGAAAFRAINSRYWNVSITGTFDAAQPLGTRVAASGGTVSNGGAIDGGSSEFPSMHGGDIANNRFTTTDS